MTEITSNREEFLKNFPITDLLDILGYTPIAYSKTESCYPYIFGDRPNNKISLIVNTKDNTWFDKKIAKGGNLEDLASCLWPGLSKEESLEELKKNQEKVQFKMNYTIKNKRKRKAIKIPQYHIDKTLPLGYTKEVMGYLEQADLWNYADINLREVHYHTSDRKGKRRNFVACGWQNENGGWEIRAQNFNSCIGTKGMTILQRSTKDVVIFQHYEQYLQRSRTNFPEHASIFILNHPEFLQAAINRAKHFSKIFFYSLKNVQDAWLVSRITSEIPETKILPDQLNQ